jgi:uncharacterized protein
VKLVARLALVVIAAGTLGMPATAAAAESSDYGCPAGSGTQGDHNLRHCGGYFKPTNGGNDIGGPTLAWQVYLPDAAQWGPGPYPTVMDYSGYEPATTIFDGLLDTFVNQGYAVAGVNIRGTGCSGGSFDYFEPTEWADGKDAVEFLAAQSWSNGDIGMVGKSYPGITPLYVASTDPPHLKAIVPGSFFADLYRDVAYPGGIQNTVFAAGWSLGSQPANQFDQQSSGVSGGDPECIKNQAGRPQSETTNPFINLEQHQFDDSTYHQRSNIYFASQVRTPVFAELAWQDEEVGANGISYVDHLPATTPWRATLLNGDHGEYYGDSVKAEIFRFLSFYLKKQVPAGDPCAGAGDGSYDAALACYQAEPRVTVLGDVNDHQQPSYTLHFPTWPVTDTVDRLYLHTGGLLDQSSPTSDEAATTYDYEPGIGTNSYGTLQGFQGNIPTDDDFWQRQPPAGSVAQFTTAPFAHDTLYTGTAGLDLWLSSTAPDTDLEVMITELHPDGNGGWLEQYVQKGWLRASQRKEDTDSSDEFHSTPLAPYQTHGSGDVQPLVPGQATPMRVEVFPFSQVFRAGTRLRVTVEAPVLAPELWGFAAIPAPAQNTIYTDPAHPSSLALPLTELAADTTFPAELDCTRDNNHYLANQPCREVAGSMPGPVLPESPLPIALVLCGLVATATAVVIRRRRLTTNG